MVPDSFAHWKHIIQQQVDSFLERHLPAPASTRSRLHEAMRYSVLAGGKRVRPLLVFAAGELTGASSTTLLPLAGAIELVHTYSLIHDDLPAMDNDTLRRGRPTCHVAFDEATALLAGDTLQALAFDWLAEPIPGLNPDTQLALVKVLAHASGYAGMAGGQAIDLMSVGHTLTLPELEQMHLMKTGALVRAAIQLGAHAGTLSSSVLDILDHFAKRVGLAFQVIDDVLDYEATSSTLGKTAGKDAAAAKPSYVSLLGLSEAKNFARELHLSATETLHPLGFAAQRLRDLADMLVNRSF